MPSSGCAIAATIPKISNIVKLLLEAGANYNLKNLDDFKAIDFAATVEVLKLLKNVSY